MKCLFLFVTIVTASFQIDYTFRVHENCDVTENKPGEDILVQSIGIKSSCDKNSLNMGCVNDGKDGSRFTGCYNTIEEVPLASVISLYYDSSGKCEGLPAGGEMQASGLCIEFSQQPQTKDSQYRYCPHKDKIMLSIFGNDQSCSVTPMDLAIATTGCDQSNAGSSTFRYCAGEFGPKPKPPPKGTQSTSSSSSRLCPFGWC